MDVKLKTLFAVRACVRTCVRARARARTCVCVFECCFVAVTNIAGKMRACDNMICSLKICVICLPAEHKQISAHHRNTSIENTRIIK